MRPILLARMPEGTTRPVLLLTRLAVVPVLRGLTVAPITTTIRGTSTEVAVGVANGLDHGSVVNCDAIQTLLFSDLGRQVGFLLDHQEKALTDALVSAFDLTV